MKRILFVCVENSNRSQMAEAFAHIHGGDGVVALSAGSRPSGVINPKAIRFMQELGYDLTTHTSKSLDEVEGEFDAVIAPYHDVGMTAIKVASFGSAVNVTLGLPFPRTSPDHGTAIDIAGRGIADPSSFIAATRLCAEIILRRRQPQ